MKIAPDPSSVEANLEAAIRLLRAVRRTLATPRRQEQPTSRAQRARERRLEDEISQAWRSRVHLATQGDHGPLTLAALATRLGVDGGSRGTQMRLGWALRDLGWSRRRGVGPDGRARPWEYYRVIAESVSG